MLRLAPAPCTRLALSWIYAAPASRRIPSVGAPRSRRFAAALATKQHLERGAHTDETLKRLETQGARILRIVKRCVDERERLKSELTSDTAAPANIPRLKRMSELEPLKEAWDEWSRLAESLVETTPLLSDSDAGMRAMAAEEHASLVQRMEHKLAHAFPDLLVPPSPTAHLGALIEFKSGAGGAESSIFLAELVRMYTRLAERTRGWKATPVSVNQTDQHGGVKDAIVEVKGEGAYDALRWESGVHRVQRIPATESGGRVHTSAAAVLVLPLAVESDAPQADDLFKMDDVRIEVMRSRGAGGQHVNKTESAVRLTHVPTGITVSMQDERSQHANKRRAFQVLRGRLLDQKLTAEMHARRSARRDLVKTMDRSEKIRTYNFPQDRVTDHRIGMSLKNLPSLMDGDGVEVFMDALRKDYEEGIMEDMLDEQS